MKTVFAGSRESELALAQAKQVTDFIEANNDGIRAEIRTMKTTGDRILNRKLEDIGGKGLFVKELDIALREGRTDFSVHSLKDMPMETAQGLPVLGYSKREDAFDVLVLPEGMSEIDFSKPVGCSSRRRILQFRELYPQADVKSVRGNVLTRLKKLDSGEYSALILAAAGLKRLGLENRINRYFTEDEMIPAAGQGILCIQGRGGEDYRYLDGFFDEEAEYTAHAERAFVRYLNGGCTSPVAAYATINGERLHLKALYVETENNVCIRGSITGTKEQAEQMGIQLAVHLRREAERILTFKNAEQDGNHILETEEITFRQGKVYLLGAGPSDVSLLTKKGLELLKTADVVVYDSLVGQEIISLIPNSARRIDVGKRASHHKKTQDEINEILLEEALAGSQTVRLKGGDPFLFGRGGEELELLVKYQIPYEIIPGVTSAIAVPAYNGIPVTHRDFASSVHIITGHRREGCLPDIDFEALVRTKGTLIFLMGISELGNIMDGLLKAGLEADTPAAVLQQGTTAAQKRLLATAGDLARAARQQGVETPAIIVVGKVCSLAEQFSWYEKKPLFGEKIIVTRPRGRSLELSEHLKQLGAEVISLPSIETTRIHESTKYQAVRTSLARIESYDVIAFTSPYGVQTFFEFLKEEHIDIRRLHGARMAAIGSATAEAIEKCGMFVEIMPEKYDAASLGDAIVENCRKDQKILIPRAQIGSEELIRHLKRQPGLQITDLPIYETSYIKETGVNLREQMENGAITMVTFTSASTVRGFVQLLPDYDYASIQAVCIGRQTENEAKKYHMRTTVAAEATAEAMIACILKLHGEKNRETCE